MDPCGSPLRGWALEVADCGEKEWLFTVELKEDGEKLPQFLDRYYMF